ncbi:hypothetical protein [Synechococcus sp. KORDI-100]|uniref:hypothetical protein n=1 Tax=Synechococcus sp. KORDI-100 TaxID=1280380 RepID=UPI0012E0297C|nr:hypothetical protein [Synechococcus sp. KORDI-100]
MDRWRTEKFKNLASNSWHLQMTVLFGKCVRLKTRACERFWACDRISFGHNPPTKSSQSCYDSCSEQIHKGVSEASDRSQHVEFMIPFGGRNAMREIHPGRGITIKMSNKAKPAMTSALVDSR